MPTAQHIMLAVHCKKTEQVRPGPRCAPSGKPFPFAVDGPPNPAAAAKQPGIPAHPQSNIQNEPSKHCQVDLKPPILSYIKSTYSDAEATAAADDLAAVAGLRAEMVTAQGSATGTPRKETLVK
jgi:hypothetical protein